MRAPFGAMEGDVLPDGSVVVTKHRSVGLTGFGMWWRTFERSLADAVRGAERWRHVSDRQDR